MPVPCKATIATNNSALFQLTVVALLYQLSYLRMSYIFRFPYNKSEPLNKFSPYEKANSRMKSPFPQKSQSSLRLGWAGQPAEFVVVSRFVKVRGRLYVLWNILSR